MPTTMTTTTTDGQTDCFTPCACKRGNDIEADDITVATQFRPGLITEVKSTIIRIRLLIIGIN